ncbi:hypothetical protein M3484_17425 [Pseudomonas sp. GX19020]|uniref:hypothetical protein n=1 Tax=Pseudomonas sp. GX19020 TaxID=2942277 RepID=UPI0020191D72|nr:hypothetical protein [Pseudomonas sp. GX19020]MCL4068350.1 hypothetical protein [Pseudomonas sp. GX19020]
MNCPARDLVQLLEMTTRYNPDDDRRALASGCEAALIRLNAGIDMLHGAKNAEASP